jgi:hypothetical protein
MFGIEIHSREEETLGAKSVNVKVKSDHPAIPTSGLLRGQFCARLGRNFPIARH